MYHHINQFVQQALAEDVGAGDHSTLSTISPQAMGKAILKVKQDGILAGVAVAQQIINIVEPEAILKILITDGTPVQYGQIAFELQAKVHTILKCERLVLNIMQRMSGIATLTHTYVQAIKPHSCTLLDTRKTTPLFRWFEKEGVRIGGGSNHRFGLYDMIMLKDNHIDYCGGITKAIDKANAYIQQQQLNIKIEVETRSIQDVEAVLAHGGVNRIMLDNFDILTLKQAVKIIGNRYETEASGGITLDTIAQYAATGVQYISAGAIIHKADSMDLSLKALID
jgi:nicotinate-nucleotide pyrophosphorylase (carboxylating)